MVGSNCKRRAISRDLDISTMLELRKQGMTNKQIANSLDIAVSTVYRYIGKRSVAAMNAAICNKEPVIPLEPWESNPTRIPNPEPEIVELKPVPESVFETEPIPEIPVETPAEPEPVVESNEEENKLKVISSRVVLQGDLCKYIVDTASATIEISGEMLSGLVDCPMLDKLIEELQEIRRSYQ